VHNRFLACLLALLIGSVVGCPGDEADDDDTVADDDDTTADDDDDTTADDDDDDTADDDDSSDGDDDDSAIGDDDDSAEPEFACGDPLEDPRDGRSYSTLTMGTQCWMGENINVGEFVVSTITDTDHSDFTDPGVIEKYCFLNDELNCEQRGGLYDWDETMQGSWAEGARGICPDGWHVPTDAEFHTLVHFVDHTAETEHDPETEGPTEVYIGTDWGEKLKVGGDSGFEWLLAGRRYMTGEFWGAEIGFLWTSSHWDPENAFLYEVFAERDDGTHPYHDMLRGHSVRCILDAP